METFGESHLLKNIQVSHQFSINKYAVWLMTKLFHAVNNVLLSLIMISIAINDINNAMHKNTTFVVVCHTRNLMRFCHYVFQNLKEQANKQEVTSYRESPCEQND